MSYSFEYLEKMFFRLREAESIRARASDDPGVQSLADAHVAAVKCSIRDYIKLHPNEADRNG